MTRKNYQLGGVTCQVCVNKIEKKLSKLEGVNEAVVNFSNEKLIVEYDEKSREAREVLR